MSADEAMRAEYEDEQRILAQRTEWWSQYYAEHPHHREAPEIVAETFQTYLPTELGHLDAETAKGRLGELVSERWAQLRRGGDYAVMVGGPPGNATPTVSTDADEDLPGSIGAVVARQAERRRAAAGKRTETSDADAGAATLTDAIRQRNERRRRAERGQR